MILARKFCALAGMAAFLGGCDSKPAGTPTQGAYGLITNQPSANIPPARQPRPLAFPPSALLTCVQTELSPAALFHTQSNSIAFFAGMDNPGPPSYLAFSTRGGPRAFRSGAPLDNSGMEENWILVWFAGANGWTNGDAPWVIYLQHKAKGISLGSNGLHLNFNGPVGDLVLLPLFGTFAPPLGNRKGDEKFGGKEVDTKKWSEVLPREPLMRIRYWASALREFPVRCDETFSVDRSTDALTIRQKTYWHSIRDDWETKSLKLNPVGPSLAIRVKDKTFPARFSRAVMDLEMPTPYGPYMAAEGEAPLDTEFVVLKHINAETKAPEKTSAQDARGTWTVWQPEADQRDGFIDAARTAYRSGEIDLYNYACYLFVRGFTQRPIPLADGNLGKRLIPSGPPSPFVFGIQREVSGPNPPLVISVKPGGWPRIELGEQSFGHVQTASDPPSRSESVPISWNTESFVVLP